MTQHDQPAAIVGWDEPEGLNPRGTVIVLPGRGEQPAVYERFGRRISADAYRVRAVASPAEDPALTEKQVRSLLDGPKPVVLAGSGTGALFAAPGPRRRRGGRSPRRRRSGGRDRRVARRACGQDRLPRAPREAGR